MIKKRGQSKIITVVLLILLILALIIILWNLVLGLLKENELKIGIEQESSKVSLLINDIDCFDASNNPVDCSSSALGYLNVNVQRSGAGTITIGNENVSRIIYENRSYTTTVNNPYNTTVNNPYNITVNETETILRPLDIIFVVDTTGSMSEEITDTKNTIISFVNIADDNLNASFKNRLSLIDYKDYPSTGCGSPGIDYPSRIHIFNGTGGNSTTENSIILKNELSTLTANGGGDGPEAMLNGLQDAINMPFRFKKVVILLADAPPHAKDCECSLYTSPYSLCSSGQDSNGDGKLDTYIATPPPATNCYQGPETIEGIKQQFIAQNTSFYYIGQGPKVYSPSNTQLSSCSNFKDKEMADQLGKFYPYNQTGSTTNVDDILLEISQTISKEVNYTYNNETNVTLPNWTTTTVDNYTNETRWELVPVVTEEEEWSKLIVRLYNENGKSCTQDITNPPKQKETKTYSIPSCITNPTFMRIYFVVQGEERLLTEKCIVPGSKQCD